MTKRLICAAALAAMAGAGAVQAEEIRVLNWQGYGTDLDWAVEAFTEETGHTVVHEYFQLGTGDADQAADQSGRL